MEEKLSLLLQQNISLTGAGRTDTGVHASCMYAHFDVLETLNNLEKLSGRLNRFLPPDISIDGIFKVPDIANARFSAISRTYQYHVHFLKNAFLNDRSWYVHKYPDTNAMIKAARLLLNFESFGAFTRTGGAASNFICHLYDCEWIFNEYQAIFTIKANRFLRNMVRAIVGTMMELGHGRITLEEFEAIVQSDDRKKAGESAPPQGLFLTDIKYPNEIQLCLK